MNLSVISEDDIIKGIKLSKPSVFKWIKNKYYPMIRQLVLMNNGTEEDAEDIFQTGVIVLWEKIKNDSFERKSSVKTFFYSVCRNQWRKKLNEKKGFMVRIDDIITPIDLPQPESDDADNFQLSHLEASLLRQFEKLDANCQKILRLYYYDKLSMATIADRIGYTTADNAKTQKYRCINKLQGLMAPEIKLHKQV